MPVSACVCARVRVCVCVFLLRNRIHCAIISTCSHAYRNEAHFGCGGCVAAWRVRACVRACPACDCDIRARSQTHTHGDGRRECATLVRAYLHVRPCPSAPYRYGNRAQPADVVAVIVVVVVVAQACSHTANADRPWIVLFIFFVSACASLAVCSRPVRYYI